jgi:hypothetical protein
VGKSGVGSLDFYEEKSNHAKLFVGIAKKSYLCSAI